MQPAAAGPRTSPLLSSSSSFHPTKIPANPSNLSLDQTKISHAHLIRTNFNPNQTHHPFDQIPSPPALLNSLISSYIRLNLPASAFSVYASARRSSVMAIDNFTAPSVLKSCAQLCSIRRGEEVHSHVVKTGLDHDVFVRNAIIQMYSECGEVESAAKAFDEMHERDVVSYSTMIRCYGKVGFFNDALDAIEKMMDAGIKLSEVAIINMLNLFADIGDLNVGWPVHAHLIKNSNGKLDYPGANASTALIHMYAKCGRIGMARRVFNRMVERTTASWSACIAGYIRCRDSRAAIELFARMVREEVLPNEITMLSMVIECGLAGALELGKLIHGYMLRNDFEMSISLATALVDMYAKCGQVESARAVFNSMEIRDIMMWTAMLSGYVLANQIDAAFDLFSKMNEAKVVPNEITMVSLLTLCADVGALDRGKWVHACINKLRMRLDVVLATALVDMYAKCGDIEGARKVYMEFKDRDVCMWNAMLNGLAMNGYGDEAIELFKVMEKEKVQPTDITFIGILRACSHSGLVEEGKYYFNRMGQEFGIVPKVEHYGCMVDLLGRAGLIEEAYEMVVQMPVEPNVIVWGALLAACKLRKNVELGETAAKELLRLEPHNTGYNVLLSNLYATQKRWDDVAEMRKVMKDTGVKKSPGVSSIEVNGLVFEFVMGDDSHPKTIEIRAMVAEMHQKLKAAGHVTDTSAVLLNLDEEEKEAALTVHSEKLAMAFGLISTPPSSPIRIVKNLRVCDDCHAATKLLSKIYKRIIIVRDRNRFHRFSDGACSCKDYW